MLNIRAIAFALACVTASPFAFAANERCGEIGIIVNEDGYGLGNVSGPKAMFIASADDSPATKSCPSSAAACRTKSYLVKGDHVLTDQSHGDYVCATYMSKLGKQTSGWLAKSQINMRQVDKAPASKAWHGDWTRDSEASITIKASGNGLHIEGNATYGAFDPQRVKSGGVNIGELDDNATPKGNMLVLGKGYSGARAPARDNADSECHVRMRLFGRYLVVEDNTHCGGHNVRFSGVYVRKGK